MVFPNEMVGLRDLILGVLFLVILPRTKLFAVDVRWLAVLGFLLLFACFCLFMVVL